MQNAATVLRLDYEAKREEILRVVQAELDALAAEYEPLLETMGENIAALEQDVRADVLAHGATVKCERLQAVYVHGRVSWDTKALDRYALDHPELARYRHQGAPSVSLRVLS